jgi:hypothetical protein
MFVYALFKENEPTEVAEPERIKCYRVFDHEDERLFRHAYIKPDLDCKIEEFYEDE